MDTPTAYIPIDWRHALANGTTLPERASGAALFADISGFTPLTEALALELGPRRGAEELTVHLNRVYDAMIAQLHRYGGSVIGFSGDAITCWLDGDDGRRATAAALAMQDSMAQFAEVETFSGRIVSLGMKAAVAVGSVRRFLVGNADYVTVDAMAGTTLENLAAAEHQANRGDVILDPAAAAALDGVVTVAEWREDEATGQRFAVVTGLTVAVADTPWPDLADDALSDDTKRAWVLPPVYTRIASGKGEFLAELRPAVALFLKFSGINYESDADAPAKLDQFIQEVQRILLRYEGSLIQLTIGDKGSYMYAAFGAPIAHEDDAIRAASTALEIQDLADGLPYMEPLQIGITVGRMRTGAYGSTTRRTYGVLGDAVNLSARLMSAAKPGQILVSDDARAATGNTFGWEKLPNIRVKGKSEPVTLARLLGLRKRDGIQLTEPTYALPMVGRRDELALIAAKLDATLAGQGQIVGITAEAGMGKSRLAAEVIGMARARRVAGYGGECQSYGTTSSYLVWQNIWRGFFDLDASLSAETQIERLHQQLADVDPLLVSRLPLLGPVLNLPIPDNDLTASLDAKVRKDSREALLVTLLRARAATGPLLLVLEDIHWIDALSADLVTEIGRASATLPVMLLLVYRPPDKQRLQLPKVDQLPHFTEVALADFTDAEAERLIALKLAHFFGEGTQVPDAFRRRITAQAAGNPFYIEELLNYLQDLGVDPADEAALEAIDLPTSVYKLVLSRIDRLTETEQITMKVASVIGRMFRASMVWGVYPELGEIQRVRQHLDVLSDLELTPLDIPDPELIYLFKHIITQQVAYESLLFATRAVLHNEIGKYIERVHGDALDEYVDLLAFHYEHSENDEKKRFYLRRAGDAARANYANSAAISYYSKAIPLLGDDDLVDVRLALGKVYDLIGEWDEAEAQYTAALALAQARANLSEQGWCATALGELHRKQAKYDSADSWLTQARAQFEQAGDLVGVGQALHYAGTLAAQQGTFPRAKALYGQSLAIREQLNDQRNIANLQSNLAIVARFEGDADGALSYNEQSLALREALGEPWAIAVSLNNLGNLHLQQANLPAAREHFENALVIWREIGERWATANTLHNLANVARDEGDFAAARTQFEESVAIWQALGDSWALAYWLEDTARYKALQDEASAAVRLAANADRLRGTAGIPLAPADAERLAVALAPARAAFDEATLSAETAAGAAMTLADAVALALS